VGKSKGNPYKKLTLWFKIRTFTKHFFDFLTSRNVFSAKVPILKVVQNDRIIRTINFIGKFFEKKFQGTD